MLAEAVTVAQMTRPPQPAAAKGFNVFAVLSIVFVWFAGILGLIFGYIALSQIKRTGERGHGLAVTAVVLGWIAVALSVAIVVMLLISGGIYVVRT